jgi:hypothetical protein
VLTTLRYLGANMTIDQDGFLSSDIAHTREKNRAQHLDSFGMITEINRVAQSVLPSFETLPRTRKNFLACGYYIRGLQSLQGAVVVTELGLVSEGYTLVRSGLETLFHLGATIRSDDFGQQMARDHVKRMRATLGHQKKVVGPDPEIEEDIPQLEAALASMLPDGVDPARMSLETVAKLAELSDLYDGLYRSLSFAHAHPSLLSIASIWDADDQHAPRGVLWGPERGDADEITTVLMLDATVMFNFATLWGRLLVQAHARETELHRCLEEVHEKYRAVLG